MASTTFIYGLNDPHTGKTRYVGKANDPYARYQAHVWACHREKTHKANWIRGLVDSGHAPILEVLDEILMSEAGFWEREWIRLYQALGVSLTNGTPGGDGMGFGEAHPLFGKPRSAEVKEKSRSKQIGRSRSGADKKTAREGQLRSGLWCTNISGYRGVGWNKEKEKYRARIIILGQEKHLGYFELVENAARARDAAVKQYHPVGSYLNFP